jgi:hypothetical protein
VFRTQVQSVTTTPTLTLQQSEQWELFGFSFDFNKKHVHYEMSLNHVEIIGRYNVNGRILVLPITGNGDINITLGNGRTGDETPGNPRQLFETR